MPELPTGSRAILHVLQRHKYSKSETFTPTEKYGDVLLHVPKANTIRLLDAVNGCLQNIARDHRPFGGAPVLAPLPEAN